MKALTTILVILIFALAGTALAAEPIENPAASLWQEVIAWITGVLTNEQTTLPNLGGAIDPYGEETATPDLGGMIDPYGEEATTPDLGGMIDPNGGGETPLPDLGGMIDPHGLGGMIDPYG